MRRQSVLFAILVSLSFVSSANAHPTIAAVLDGASFQPLVVPGSPISIFGRELAPSTLAASSLPLPMTLDGVTVKIDGVAAPFYFVSPGQINAQLPFGITADEVELVVITAEGPSEARSVPVLPSAPGIFTLSADGKGVPFLFDSSFRLLDTVMPGQRVILYAAGLGEVEPAGATGEAGAVSEPFNRVVDPPEVYIGGRRAEVEFAGLAPGLTGVYQLNVVAPEAFTNDRVFLISGGRRSNSTEITADLPSVVRGSGVIVSERRSVEEFQRVQLFAVATVRVTVGAALSQLRIEGEDNLVGLVTTEVRDGALLVSALGPYTTTTAVEISISVPTLERVEHLGVGDLIANNVSGEHFEVFMSGVGNVTVSGSVESIDVLMQGVGNVSLFGLEAKDGRALMTGVGNLEVTATDSLFARVYGIGNMIYRGNPPIVDAEAEGFGTVRPE